MSLRDRLRHILPSLLPLREEDAIKGTELIARVRDILGEEYSDRTLRSQFSFIAIEPDSCLARVPNGQGYYLRPEGTAPSLHTLFESEDCANREGSDPLHKALALAVRLYDTAGLGVFVYPVDGEESWSHPDLVAVQWPAGNTDAQGAYILSPGTEGQAHFRAVCVAQAQDAESCRHAFFRTLACGLWAQESELLLIGEDIPADLSNLAALYGVGIRCLSMDTETLAALPRADTLFRASTHEARSILSSIPQLTLAQPRCTSHPAESQQDMPDTAAVIQWAQGCLARGRIEPYEFRVAIN